MANLGSLALLHCSKLVAVLQVHIDIGYRQKIYESKYHVSTYFNPLANDWSIGILIPFLVFVRFWHHKLQEIIISWLVVSTPLKYISQLGWLFPIYGKNMFQTTNQYLSATTIQLTCLFFRLPIGYTLSLAQFHSRSQWGEVPHPWSFAIRKKKTPLKSPKDRTCCCKKWLIMINNG